MPRDPVNQIDRHIGSRIKVRRELLRMSAGEAAARLGVSRTVLIEYEAGLLRVEVLVLRRLVTLLGVKLRYFFDGIEGHARAGAAVDGALARKAE